MDAPDRHLTWIVCHRATRSVSRLAVRCPLRGEVAGVTCLSCRHLTTSSVEREGPWCEVPVTFARRTERMALPMLAPGRVALPIEPVRPLTLPVLAATRPGVAPVRPSRLGRRAVRPPAAVPSGHGIGT